MSGDLMSVSDSISTTVLVESSGTYLNTSTEVTKNNLSSSLNTSEDAGVYSNVVFNRFFNLYLMFPLLFVGLAGNILVVVVMRDKSFKNLPISIYFTAIAVSDAAMLISVSVLQFLKELAQVRMFAVTRLCSTIG